MRKPKKDTVELTCRACGKKQRFAVTSPAARVLSACEEAEKLGWSFSADFFSMLTGDHRTMCRSCNGGG